MILVKFALKFNVKKLFNLISSKNINKHIEECHSYNVGNSYLNVYNSLNFS